MAIQKNQRFFWIADTNHKLDYTCKKLDIAVEKRVPDTSNKNKLEDLILLKSINRKASYRYGKEKALLFSLPYCLKKNLWFFFKRYYAIRAQTEYANTKAKNMISLDQPKESRYTEIYNIKNVANSVNICNRLKEKLDDKVDYCGNKLKLLSISEATFINMLKEVYEKRKEVSINDDSNSEEYLDQD